MLPVPPATTLWWLQYLFPNPSAELVSDDYLFHFEFLGRVLAKAVFEDILVEPLFSPVFLNKLLGRVSSVLLLVVLMLLLLLLLLALIVVVGVVARRCCYLLWRWRWRWWW